jgi:regulator of replication initiation timing
MTPANEDELRRRIADLEAENAELRAERKELRERIYGPVREEDLPGEEVYLEMMKNHVPGAGLKFLAELGIYPMKQP